MSKLIATAGPFSGIRSVPDAPYEDSQKYGWNAQNGYFRSADGVMSWLCRPGFTLTNASSQMGTGQRMQGTFAFTDPSSGTIYRFFVVNGVLYRSDSTFATFTAVTPGTVAIDTGATTRVSFVAVGSAVVVTDGVNRPWVMTAFASTPVTGAYIDIDGAGGSWSTWGKPTVYQDSVMFITKTVPGGSAVTPRVGIVWCEPNQPTVGYTQTGYADFWNIIETGGNPLYAILGTNNGLFYWRAASIGIATGTPSINFSSTATRDYRGDPVGTVSPWAVVLFEGNIFFLDAQGRPWMMPVAGEPQPIWLQDVTSPIASQIDPSFLSYTAVAAVVPELNQVAMAILGDPTAPSSRQSPPSALVFDGASGAYAGFWTVNGTQIGFDVLDAQLDANGLRVLCVGGGNGSPSAGSGGYVWILSSLAAASWYDKNGSSPGIVTQFYTQGMGYSATRLLVPDTATFIVRSTEQIGIITVVTPYGQTAIGPGPTPQSSDVLGPTAYRATLGLDGVGVRWIKFIVVGPTAPTLQGGLTRVEVFGSLSTAGPTDR